ncbi:MAG TPA: VRR-NUC domain-containing protein [Candidatus Acidoferrum sp.]|nr:VRR-NUC domain-containing protein [Candidatus Acidoferrum sp.]
MSRPFRLTAPIPSENDVEAGCLTILDLHHYWVKKLHAGVFKTLDGRRHIKGVPKGTPDYVCCHEVHRNFLLEVKRPGGQLNPDQEVQIAVIREQYRVPVVVVESVEELCAWLALHEHPPALTNRVVEIFGGERPQLPP